MNELVQKCSHYEQPHTCYISVNEGSNLKSGELTVEVKRVRLDRSYVQRKAEDLSKRLHEQLLNIETFNSDDANDLEMEPNISGPGGTSILDALIKLRDPLLLEKLQQMGVRFPVQGESEGPLDKAKQLRKRSQKKLDDYKASDGAIEQEVKIREDQVKEYDEIIEILNKMSYDPNSP